MAKCKSEGCKIRASFNFKGLKPSYCKSHKEDFMINVKDKTCENPECSKQPSYNLPGNKIPRFCVVHKEKNMINVISKTCENPECLMQPTYNLPGNKIPRFCFTHKKNDMINVISKTCENPECLIIPTYNFLESKTARFCKTHKENGMVDVINKTCENPDCLKQPAYNLPGNKIPRFCVVHKEKNMINVKTPICKTYLCDIQVSNKKYEGYCLRCFIHTFPDKPITRNYKTKEKTTTDFVISQYPEHKWISDKIISGGCSKRRPDLLLDLGDQFIIIEIDENQHTNYDCSCENKRLMELSQDLGHIPAVMIRFNPDDYINSESKNITSCWDTNKLGVYTIKKTKQKEWTNRLQTLKENIDYWMKNRTEKTMEVIQLFYDLN
jgi:hypothetical protein